MDTSTAEIRAVIVDDEPLARERIGQLLEAYPDIRVVAECSEGFDAVKCIRDMNPDLLFLDIQMPEKDGFEVLEEISRPRPYIIFTTAYDEYALKAFEYYALDYLLKPVDEERFGHSLKRVRDMLKKDRFDQFQQRVENLLSKRGEREEAKSEYRTKIPIKKSDRIFFVNDGEIISIQASGKYVEVQTEKKKHRLRSLLSEFHEILNPAKFIRIHRSVVINIDHIREIHPWFRSEYQVEMSDGSTFTTGKTFRKNLTDLIDT